VGAWADELAKMAGFKPIIVDVPTMYDLANTPGVAEVAEDYYFNRNPVT
jgi:hypothetical protein